MTQPPEIHLEPRTDQQRTEDDIVTACRTIREHWLDTLPTGTPAQKISSGSRGGGIVAADDSATDADIDPVTRAVSTRRYVIDILNPWCRLVMEDRDITNPKSLPHGRDVIGMCQFLERQAQWISGQDSADDARRELAGIAAALAALQPPKMSRDEYLTSRQPDRWFIGRCPLSKPSTDAQPQAEPEEPVICDGKVYAYPDEGAEDGRDLDQYERRRNPWATCDRCRERGVTSWWETQVFGSDEIDTLDRQVGVDEVVRIAASQFGRHVSKQAVWQWVSRGKLVPTDKDAKPHTFRLYDVIDTLTAREAG